MEYVLVAILGLSGLWPIGQIFLNAAREPNDGDFWDGANPSGFHRFAPSAYAALVYIFLMAFVVFLIFRL